MWILEQNENISRACPALLCGIRYRSLEPPAYAKATAWQAESTEKGKPIMQGVYVLRIRTLKGSPSGRPDKSGSSQEIRARKNKLGHFL